MLRCKLGGAAFLALAVVCHPETLHSARAESLATFSVPSPDGKAEAIKVYAKERRTFLISVAQPLPGGGRSLTPILAGSRPIDGFGSERVFVGWNGNNDLVISGRLDGMVSYATTAGSISIHYINEETGDTQTKYIMLINMKNVIYSVERNVTDNLVDCAINMHGQDHQVFNDVSLKIKGRGVGLSHVEGQGGGSLSLLFSSSRLAAGASPALTLTEAKLDDVDVFSHRQIPSPGPVQDGLGLTYTVFNRQTATEILNKIQRPNYSIFFGLTFGQKTIRYYIDQPIDSKILEDFAKCEAGINLFAKPLLTDILKDTMP